MTLEGGEHDTQLWEALLDLMELAMKVSRHEKRASMASGPDEYTTDGLLTMASLHEELQSWQKRLPAQLRWDPTNNASPSVLCKFLQ